MGAAWRSERMGQFWLRAGTLESDLILKLGPPRHGQVALVRFTRVVCLGHLVRDLGPVRGRLSQASLLTLSTWYWK